MSVRRPVMRAEGIVVRETTEADGEKVTRVLVQCDRQESFYRFPGGSVEFGETAATAIVREFQEEFALPVDVGALAAVAEDLLQYEGRDYHQCTLIHWSEIADGDVRERYQHREHEEIQLVWRTLDELGQRPVYPTGMMEHLLSGDRTVRHLVENQMGEKMEC